jgi:hypothetical protein
VEPHCAGGSEIDGRNLTLVPGPLVRFVKLGSFWVRFGFVLGSFWVRFGFVSTLIWNVFNKTFGLHYVLKFFRDLERFCEAKRKGTPEEVVFSSEAQAGISHDYYS